MTISELAKIALDEGRVVNASKKSWEDDSEFITLEWDGTAVGYCRLRFCTNELAADDWYEVRE